MRRLFANLLFMTFLLPIILPALGQGAEDGVPACCRRNGTHHCAMTMAQQRELTAKNSGTPRWQVPLERCPYCPATLTAPHVTPLLGPVAQVKLAEFFSHPSGVAQTESRWRIARDRSRQKRGPPAAVLS